LHVDPVDCPPISERHHTGITRHVALRITRLDASQHCLKHLG
jgi:hypothetical protein